MKEPSFSMYLKANINLKLTIELNRRYWATFDREEIPGYVAQMKNLVLVSWDIKEGGAASLDWIKSTIIDLTGGKIVDTFFFNDEIHFKLEAF